MADQQLYITLLIFVKRGEEEVFHSYEDKVLPLLARYNGQLLYRIRPEQNSFVYSPEDKPYEIHLVSFASKEDFENYKKDQERMSYAPLFGKSVEKVMLIEEIKI